MYATKADMLARYADADLRQLTDCDEPYQGAIVDAVLDQALADASEEMDAYLRPRFRLPLSAAPDILKRLACRLAYFNLHRNLPPEEVSKARDQALQQLAQIRDRKLDIGIAEDVPAAQPASGPVYAGGPRVFTRDTLEGV